MQDDGDEKQIEQKSEPAEVPAVADDLDEVKWSSTAGVPVDNRASSPASMFRARLMWPDAKGPNEPRTYLEYFKFFFPISLLLVVVSATNENLRAAGVEETSLEEMYQWLGFLLAMCLVKYPTSRLLVHGRRWRFCPTELWSFWND
jgi:hypothetical protein